MRHTAQRRFQKPKANGSGRGRPKAAKRKGKGEPSLLKLDFGCGPHKREGFHGVDAIQFAGVDTVWDLRKAPWPWKDSSVAEAHASHFIEHLTQVERMLFFNELYRVLVPGGTCMVIVPHWCSQRAYGDMTHQWPPVSEFFFYYLSKPWRAANAPHCDVSVNPAGLDCDLEVFWGYNYRPDMAVKSQEYIQDAQQNYKEVLTDTVATMKALKPEK